MERKPTFGNRDTKLLARVERKKIREENHKRWQDQATEEKEMLTVVLGGKESDGSVKEQTGEDFCEPPKQRKNSDLIASIIRESQGCVEDFVLSQMST